MRSWADDFNTYTEACEYYGAETPAQLEAEARYYAQEEREAMMDAMMAGVIMPGAFLDFFEDSILF